MRNSVGLGLIVIVSGVAWLLLRGADDVRGPDVPSATGEPETARIGRPPGEEQDAEPVRRIELAEPFTPPNLRDAVIRGQVVSSATGRPVTGCRMQLKGWESSRLRLDLHQRQHGDVLWEHPPEQITGADGRFEFTFDPPPPFEFVLHAEHEDFVPMYREWTQVVPGQRVELGDFRLIDGAEVRGLVIDGKGRPQSGVRVEANQFAAHLNRLFGLHSVARQTRNRAPRPVTTNRDGTFALSTRTATGTWDLRVGGRSLESPPQFIIKPGQRRVEVTIVVTPAGALQPIAGVVVDDLGAPVENATVTVMLPKRHGVGPSVVTNAAGEFIFPYWPHLPREALWFCAERDGYERIQSVLPLDWGTSRNRLVVRRGISVIVRVTDKVSGGPIETYGVRIQPAARRHEFTHLRNVGTHPSGITTVGPLRRGDYRLWVVADGMLPQDEPVALQLVDTNPHRFEVQLTRGVIDVALTHSATILGRLGPQSLLDRLWREVYGRSRGDELLIQWNSPCIALVRNASVRVAGFTGETILDRQGRFRLDGVPVGDWSVYFSMRHGRTWQDWLRLEPIAQLRGDETRELDLQLDEAALDAARERR